VEKEAIAREAMKCLQSDMTVAFSAGTTTWNIAKMVRGFENLTFVTNSTNVALALQDAGWDQIILSGGHFRTPSDALVGPIAERTTKELYSDVLFLGVHALDWAAGLSTPNVTEAAIDRVFIENTRKVVVVMDHSKWGQRALCSIAPMSVVDVLITDDGIDADDISRLRARGIEVRAVSVLRDDNGHDRRQKASRPLKRSEPIP